MPLPQIAVEIVVPEAPTHGNSQKKNPVESSDLRRALLQACTDTVQVAVCVSSDTARHAAALALVFWKPSGRVRIEVGSKDAPGGQTWSSRELEFSSKDAPVERWRAAGYAAGTLASLVVRGDRAGARTSPPPATAAEDKGGHDAEAPSASADAARTPEPGSAAPTEKPAAKPPPPPLAPEPATEREKEDEDQAKPSRSYERPAELWQWAFDVAGVYGSGISRKNWRTGGLVRVSRAFGGPFVTASVGYAWEHLPSSGIDVKWVSPSIGVGYAIPLGKMFTLEARAELVAELLHAREVDPTTGEADSGNQWLGGGRFGAGFAWAPFDAAALFVGGAFSARGPETDMFVTGSLTTSTPLTAAQLEAALRFTLR